MKAIALISGGLDSMLEARLIQVQGIEVIPLNFQIPFRHTEQKKASIDFKSVDISADFLKVLENPRYGFGSNMNPCIDCKILMLRKAKELMPQLEAGFIVTGEVLGQRPMSQNKPALQLIEKESGLSGLLLRPLSAKLLPQTIPEKEGWVSRDKLMDFSGRSRKAQIALARSLGIKEYKQPAGGCLLTDPEFTKRLKELIAHKGLNLANVELLKMGRHFRLSDKAKLVVGRDEKENEKLSGLCQGEDYLFEPADLAGPTALGRGVFNKELIQLACSITARYCDLNGNNAADIIYRKTGTVPEGDCPCLLKAAPIEEAKLVGLRI